MNNKYKILLVEDDENIRIMVGAMLESAGYQVIETGSCATAITLASSHIPDLIVLDLGLPDMDGMELLETVRKTDLIPIIVLSARVDEPEKVKAFDLGANDYITKPFGTNKNARRAAMVHLSFNVIGTAVWLSAFAAVDALASPALFDAAASHAGIATAHSLFNIACTVLLLPASALLEKLAYTLVPETEEKSRITMLDERLLATPVIALERSHTLAGEMAAGAASGLDTALSCLFDYSAEKVKQVREQENFTDKCEDEISAYLVKLSAIKLSDEYSTEAASLLKIIGDQERISDRCCNIALSLLEGREHRLHTHEGTADHGKIYQMHYDLFLKEFLS